jgi:hypothetical protein
VIMLDEMLYLFKEAEKYGEEYNWTREDSLGEGARRCEVDNTVK